MLELFTSFIQYFTKSHIQNSIFPEHGNYNTLRGIPLLCFLSLIFYLVLYPRNFFSHFVLFSFKFALSLIFLKPPLFVPDRWLLISSFWQMNTDSFTNQFLAPVFSFSLVWAMAFIISFFLLNKEHLIVPSFSVTGRMWLWSPAGFFIWNSEIQTCYDERFVSGLLLITISRHSQKKIVGRDSGFF